MIWPVLQYRHQLGISVAVSADILVRSPGELIIFWVKVSKKIVYFILKQNHGWVCDVTLRLHMPMAWRRFPALAWSSRPNVPSWRPKEWSWNHAAEPSLRLGTLEEAKCPWIAPIPLKFPRTLKEETCDVTCSRYVPMPKQLFLVSFHLALAKMPNWCLR